MSTNATAATICAAIDSLDIYFDLQVTNVIQYPNTFLQTRIEDYSLNFDEHAAKVSAVLPSFKVVVNKPFITIKTA